MRITDLKAGQKLRIVSEGFINVHEFETQFLGFSDHKVKYSEQPVFKSWSEVKTEYGIRTIPQLEAKFESMKLEYGQGIYAIFKDPPSEEYPEGMVWAAYIYNGRFALGSGAQRFSITLLEQNASIA